MNEVATIVESLGLDELSTEIIELLISYASYSVGRKKLIQTLGTLVQYEDELTTQINQMKTLGLISEITSPSGFRLKLVKDMRALDEATVVDVVKIAKQLAGTTDSFNILLNNVKKICRKNKTINLTSNAYKIITTCALISTRKWGMENNTISKVKEITVEKSQINLFEPNLTHPSAKPKSNVVTEAQIKPQAHAHTKTKKHNLPNNSKGEQAMIINWVEVAKKILEDEKTSLHVDEIASIAIERKLVMGDDVKKIAAKFSVALATNLKAKKSETILFAKEPNGKKGYKKGIYKLKRTRIQPTITPDVIEINSKNHTNYTGKAGEFSVLSELLFRGFNASIMTVDEGIDVVASKNNKYFHIQIKTANISMSVANHTFTINKASFLANNFSGTFYVFVLRKQLQKRWINDFVILPSSEVDRLVRNKVIKDAEKFSIRIDEHKQQFLVNKYEIISNFVNNFGVIK